MLSHSSLECVLMLISRSLHYLTKSIAENIQKQKSTYDSSSWFLRSRFPIAFHLIGKMFFLKIFNLLSIHQKLITFWDAQYLSRKWTEIHFKIH